MTRNRRQKDSSGSEREGLQDGAETCYQVRFGDSGTKKPDRRLSWKGRVEDVKIVIRSKQDGQD